MVEVGKDFRIAEPAAGRPLAIGRFHSPDGDFLLPVSLARYEKAKIWFRERFRSLGVEAGDSVLLMITCESFAQFGPVHAGLRDLGAVCPMCEPFAADAYRSAALLRLMKVKLLLGLALPVVDGWEAAQAGSAKELLAPVPFVFADAAAGARLAALGVSVRSWADIGASIAIECPVSGGLHYDASVSPLESRDGAIFATGVDAASGKVASRRTHARGTITNAACGCGSGDPRILPPGHAR